jgi:hypothetical protein
LLCRRAVRESLASNKVGNRRRTRARHTDIKLLPGDKRIPLHAEVKKKKLYHASPGERAANLFGREARPLAGSVFESRSACGRRQHSETQSDASGAGIFGIRRVGRLSPPSMRPEISKWGLLERTARRPARRPAVGLFEIL